MFKVVLLILHVFNEYQIVHVALYVSVGCDYSEGRIDCGFSGIIRAACVAQGCCFDPSGGNNNCYPMRGKF